MHLSICADKRCATLLVPRQTAKLGFVAVVLLVHVGTVAGQAETRSIQLFDFDETPLAQQWGAVGSVRAARKAPPEPLGVDAEEGGPTGLSLVVQTKGKAGVYAKSGHVPRDWRKFDHLSFWVHRTADARARHPTSTVEVQMLESDGRTRFWRKVDVDHEGWTKVAIPLRWFRWSSGRIPDWDKVDRFGFWFRDTAELSIDTISVSSADGDAGAYLTNQDLIEVGFPDRNESEIRTARNESAVVITDVAALDTERLARHLHAVAQAIRHDMPFLPHPERPPVLFVFANRVEYEAFSQRFAQRMNSVGAAPRDGSGYSFHGVSSSFWNAELGTLRPVFTHEYVHGYLSRTIHISSVGEWLHEGLASAYQLKFHPQNDIGQIVQRGIRDHKSYTPLSELCNGDRIPLNRYWQAMTAVEFLRDSPEYGPLLPHLIRAFQESRSTNLGPQLQPVLNTNGEHIERQWEQFCRNRYGN